MDLEHEVYNFSFVSPPEKEEEERNALGMVDVEKESIKKLKEKVFHSSLDVTSKKITYEDILRSKYNFIEKLQILNKSLLFIINNHKC